MPVKLSFEEQFTQAIYQRTLDLLNVGISEDGEVVNPLSVESSRDENGFQVEDVIFDMPRKRVQGNDTDPATALAWYPWQDRIIFLCT
ncbi:hypothetical protein CPC08DRAFT_769113 [Agrocybe pediades]|nr:hypothetical protein CPC08DRAFT_769113 [Agrocybe pediades]